MALTIGGDGGAATISGGRSIRYSVSHPSFRRHIHFSSPSNSNFGPPLSSPRNTTTTIVAASRKPPKTGKFDSKNKRSTATTIEEVGKDNRAVMIEPDVGETAEAEDYSDYFLPDLPGLQKDFWEGPEWDGFGFLIQYLWAFGILFSLVSSGIAVATYNEGASDFKETPAYKESIQSRELLEEPEGSTSDVFESNPTEQAPSLE